MGFYAGPAIWGDKATVAVGNRSHNLVDLVLPFPQVLQLVLETDDPANGNWEVERGAGRLLDQVEPTPSPSGEDDVTIPCQTLKVRWVQTAGATANVKAFCAPYDAAALVLADWFGFGL